MEDRVRLVEHGKHLWTRKRAAKIRTEVEARLRELEAGSVLVLDLEGVEVFDYSFANELFGKILINVKTNYPGLFVVFENLEAYARENLEHALKSLRLAAIERRDGTLSLIGKLHLADRATFEAIPVSQSGTVTAAELAKKLSTSTTAMNERLSKLTRLGLVRRTTGVSEAGRERFEYRVLC